MQLRAKLDYVGSNEMTATEPSEPERVSSVNPQRYPGVYYLVPGLFALVSEVTVGSSAAFKDGASTAVSLLDFHMQRTFEAYCRLAEAYADVADAWRDAPTSRTTLSYTDHPIGFAVHDFLGAARCSQNAVLGLLGFFPKKRSVPSSLNEAVKRLDKLEVDTEIADLIRTYWKTHGARLKDYRDYGEHFGIITDDCVVGKTSDSRMIVRCLLPDNPTCKSHSKATFTTDVHAGLYVLDELLKLFSFVRRIVVRLVQLAAPDADSALLWISRRGVVIAPRFPIKFPEVGATLPTATGIQVPLPDALCKLMPSN